MKYYWILKYILYCSTTRKNLVASYYEGAFIAWFIMSPIIFLSFLLDYWNYALFLILCGLILLVDWIITWDDDRVSTKYHYLDTNKWKMEKEFKIVRFSIFFNTLIFVLGFVIAEIRDAGWL